jgi:DUF2075 family protein
MLMKRNADRRHNEQTKTKMTLLLGRGIHGIYHQAYPKHLQRYVDEFAVRYNSRDIKDNERFELSVKNSAGRLKYTQLIGK